MSKTRSVRRKDTEPVWSVRTESQRREREKRRILEEGDYREGNEGVSSTMIYNGRVTGKGSTG